VPWDSTKQKKFRIKNFLKVRSDYYIEPGMEREMPENHYQK
jgi:hypothetical protein